MRAAPIDTTSGGLDAGGVTRSSRTPGARDDAVAAASLARPSRLAQYRSVDDSKPRPRAKSDAV